jgi:UrcA family protein
MKPLKPFRLVAGSLSLLIVTAVAASMASLTTRSSDHAAARTAITVNFGDLNLATPDGVDALKRRVRDAAKQLCGPVYPADLREEAARERCMDEAISRALAYVGVSGQ